MGIISLILKAIIVLFTMVFAWLCNLPWKKILIGVGIFFALFIIFILAIAF